MSRPGEPTGRKRARRDATGPELARREATGPERAWRGLLGPATALLLAAAALASGPLAALLVSPLALALVLSPASRLAPGAGRSLLGLGLAALAVSAVLAVWGSPWLGLGAGALAAATARLGLTRALEESPLEEGPAPAAAVALDELWGLGIGLARRALPGLPPARQAQRLTAAAERRRAAGWDRDPAAAHARPPVLDKPRVERIAWPGGGGAERLRAPSEFMPFDPEVSALFLAEPRGRDLDAFLLRRPGGPRPALLCVAPPGFANPRRLAALFATRRLDGLGLDLALMPLASGGSRDPLETSAALAKAVWDLRRLAGWLRAEGAPAIGVAGIGSGASVAALLAGIDSRLVCAVLGLPVVSPAAHLWRALPVSLRDAWAAAGADRELLEQVLAPCAPLGAPPRVPHPGRLLLAARGDRLVPSAEVQALRRHWESPALHWLPGSRGLPGGVAPARERVETLLRESLLAAGQGEALVLTRFRSPRS